MGRRPEEGPRKFPTEPPHVAHDKIILFGKTLLGIYSKYAADLDFFFFKK